MSTPIRTCIESLEPYNPGKPIEELERELGVKNIVKLASNENPLGPSPKAIEAIKSVLNEVNLYPDGGGYYLRQKLARIHNVDPDEIILGNGSDEIVGLITQLLIEPGDEVVISEGAFIRYPMAVKLMDGKSVIVPASNLRHDPVAMRHAVTGKTKIVFICNPNNPTGTILSSSEVYQFMRNLPENILVVFDEAYYEYVTNFDYPKTMHYFKNKRNVIILRTFSKIYGLAGTRVGYGFANADLVRNLNRVRPPFNVNRLAQVAALASLGDIEHVKKSIESNNRGKEYLYSELKKMKIPYLETEANFILIDTRKDGDVVYKKLLEQGIIVRPMKGMYQWPGHLRVTIGTEEQNKRFIDGLKIVLAN